MMGLPGVQIITIVALIVTARAEKPVGGKGIGRPIFQPSGRIVLPLRQEQEPGIPHTVYGPPATQPPEPEEPPNTYGPPGEGTPHEPQGSYGPPNGQSGGYQYQRPETPFPEPNNGYGPPQQPDNEYGTPQTSAGQYGVPGNEPGGDGTGQLPVDKGASERLRQQQFFQHLPNFEPSKFARPQKFRLQAQSQKIRRPQIAQRPVVQSQFSHQQQQQLNQFRQKQQSQNDLLSGQSKFKPKIESVSSGEYYVVEPNGRLQKVTYTTKNGRLVDGDITSGLQVDRIQTINAPVYSIDEFNHLVRIN